MNFKIRCKYSKGILSQFHYGVNFLFTLGVTVYLRAL